MFSTAQNAAKLEIRISPEGPFLIKAKEGLDPTRPDMEFVRLSTAYGDALHVPGSSLKGVVRSSCEALLKTSGVRLGGVDVCDPLDMKTNCGANRRRGEPKKSYGQHCAACRLFGSTQLAGRARFGDLLPWSPESDEEARVKAIEEMARFVSVRNGVGINRRTGQASSGVLFELEVLCGGQFHGDIVLQNYELWQLGLILLVLERVDDGTLRLGFGKSRGLGRVRLAVDRLTIDQFGPGSGEGGLRSAKVDGVAPKQIASPVAGDLRGIGTRYMMDAGTAAGLRPALYETMREELKL